MKKRRGRTKKQRLRLKKIKTANIKLCKKYPWIKPQFHPWTGRKWKGYDYQFTWKDDFPDGWYKAFGKMMFDEIDEVLKKYGDIKTLEDDWPRFSIQQIESKFGSLRFYFTGRSEIHDIVNKYEVISQNTCECCGKPDVPMYDDGWMTPLCYDCFKKKERRREKYFKNYGTKDFHPKTEEELQERYKKYSNDDNTIPDSYMMTHFKDGKEESETIDISETVKKVREFYDKRKEMERKRST